MVLNGSREGLFLAALAALVLYVAGSRMPREHRSVVTVTLRANRSTVWAAITDYAAVTRALARVVALDGAAPKTPSTSASGSRCTAAPARRSSCCTTSCR